MFSAGSHVLCFSSYPAHFTYKAIQPLLFFKSSSITRNHLTPDSSLVWSNRSTAKMLSCKKLGSDHHCFWCLRTPEIAATMLQAISRLVQPILAGWATGQESQTARHQGSIVCHVSHVSYVSHVSHVWANSFGCVPVRVLTVSLLSSEDTWQGVSTAYRSHQLRIRKLFPLLG